MNNESYKKFSTAIHIDYDTDELEVILNDVSKISDVSSDVSSSIHYNQEQELLFLDIILPEQYIALIYLYLPLNNWKIVDIGSP